MKSMMYSVQQQAVSVLFVSQKCKTGKLYREAPENQNLPLPVSVSSFPNFQLH